jgi:hypothetical protein
LARIASRRATSTVELTVSPTLDRPGFDHGIVRVEAAERLGGVGNGRLSPSAPVMVPASPVWPPLSP